LASSEKDTDIEARPGFDKKLVEPFAMESGPTETIYLVSRTEQARDRRIRRWIVEALNRTADGNWNLFGSGRLHLQCSRHKEQT
jgi:hypothetical protein